MRRAGIQHVLWNIGGCAARGSNRGTGQVSSSSGNSCADTSSSKRICYQYRSAGVDRDSGVGIVMAFEALQAIGATPSAVITSAGATIVTEELHTANGALDPSETVTVSFCIQNIGGVNTTNLVGTLQASGGVTSASGPQNYGVVVAGGPPFAETSPSQQPARAAAPSQLRFSSRTARPTSALSHTPSRSVRRTLLSHRTSMA